MIGDRGGHRLEYKKIAIHRLIEVSCQIKTASGVMVAGGNVCCRSRLADGEGIV